MKCYFDVELLLRLKKNNMKLTDTEKYFTLIASGDLERLKYYIPKSPEG